MRKIILSSLLTLGLGQAAVASYMTPYELERANKCTKNVCFGNDEGAGFLRFCDASWPPIFPGTIPVMGPVNNCYCPCTGDYLAGARRI